MTTESSRPKGELSWLSVHQCLSASTRGPLIASRPGRTSRPGHPTTRRLTRRFPRPDGAAPALSWVARTRLFRVRVPKAQEDQEGHENPVRRQAAARDSLQGRLVRPARCISQHIRQARRPVFAYFLRTSPFDELRAARFSFGASEPPTAPNRPGPTQPARGWGRPRARQSARSCRSSPTVTRDCLPCPSRWRSRSRGCRPRW